MITLRILKRNDAKLPTNLQNYSRNKENYAEKSNRILIAKTEKTGKNVETKQRTNAVKHTMRHEIFACFNFCDFRHMFASKKVPETLYKMLGNLCS